MGLVGNFNTNLSREVFYARRDVEEAMKLAGCRLLVRRAWTLEDENSGAITRCPDCWNTVLLQCDNSRCTTCYGTGYAGGGYRPVEPIRGFVNEANSKDKIVEARGERTSDNVQIQLPCTPIYTDGDVIAEVRAYSSGKVTEIGRVFMVDGPLAIKTLQGSVSNNKDGNMKLEDLVISQSATAKTLLGTDTKMLRSSYFWGLTVEGD